MSKEKLDFGQIIKDLDGNEVRLGAQLDAGTMEQIARAVATLPSETQTAFYKAIESLAKKPFTLCEAAISSLTTGYEDERQLADDERLKRFRLALRLKPGMVKIQVPEERDLIKKCIGKRYLSNLIAPQCWLLLEGKTMAAEAEEPEEKPAVATTA